MKAHIGVDDDSGPIHSGIGTAANVADVTQVDRLLHGEKSYVCASVGWCRKAPEHEGREVIWSVAARRSTYKSLGKRSLLGRVIRQIEKTKAQTRAKVEHPFRVIKRQFGYTKVRFRGDGEEHCPVGHAVRPVESVDDAKALTRRRGAYVMRGKPPANARWGQETESRGMK